MCARAHTRKSANRTNLLTAETSIHLYISSNYLMLSQKIYVVSFLYLVSKSWYFDLRYSEMGFECAKMTTHVAKFSCRFNLQMVWFHTNSSIFFKKLESIKKIRKYGIKFFNWKTNEQNEFWSKIVFCFYADDLLIISCMYTYI